MKISKKSFLIIGLSLLLKISLFAETYSQVWSASGFGYSGNGIDINSDGVCDLMLWSGAFTGDVKFYRGGSYDLIWEFSVGTSSGVDVVMPRDVNGDGRVEPVDIDGDGVKEVLLNRWRVVGTTCYHTLEVYNAQTHQLEWSSSEIQSSLCSLYPSLEDIDNDGKFEIIYNTFDSATNSWTCHVLKETSISLYYIKGYVKNINGIGIKDVTVYLTGSKNTTYTTDINGYYEFLNLPSGNYTVTPSKSGYSFEPSNRSYSQLSNNQENQNFIGSPLLPTISISTTSMNFSAIQGGSNPASQTFTITNSGASGSTLTWTMSDDTAWLTVSPSSGSLGSGASATLTASVDISGLSAGTYNATITVSDPNATNSPQTISVTLTISAQSKPTISLDKTSMNFSAIQGGSNPASQTFTITNSGVSGSTLTWTISDDATWLTLSPSSGSLNSGASATVTASVDISGLSTGIYNATITVSDPDATNSPQTISVTLTISANPILSVNVSTLDFGEVKRNESKTMSFRIANIGGGTLVGSISSDKTWIKVSPTSFEISAGDSKYIYVTVDNSILNQGDYREYTGNVNITSNGGNTTIIVKLIATCVRTKPNPYKISSDKPLVFWGSGVVPYNTTIRIYTLSGDLVKTLSETEGKNEIYWDGRAENGTKVAPGIYLYTSESPKEKTSGKFIVVK